MNEEVIKQIIGALVRNALTALFTLLVAKGWLSSSDMPSAVTVTLLAGGIAGVVCTVLWSVYQKFVSRFKLSVALQIPERSATPAAVEHVVAATATTNIIQNKPDPVALAQVKL